MKDLYFDSLSLESNPMIASHWVESAERLIELGRPNHLIERISTLGVPSVGLLQTPYSAAIAIRGYMAGRRFVHHERRGYLPMTESLLPDQGVSTLQNGVPQWVDGIRRAPKYFSFGLDAVFPPYDPNYRQKWLSHELLHMLCGFHWSPQITPFELYLSARLSELLPVVHWYGLDEMFRQRCFRHQGKLLFRQHCLDCEREFGFYWDVNLSESLRQFATQHAEHAILHFQTEMDACRLELETGRLHPTPRPGLNSSSDARGYLRGHYNRLTSWSFGAWVEMFLAPDRDYHRNIANQLVHTQQLFEGLLREPCLVDDRLAKQRFERRRVQDFGARALMALEWLEDDSLCDVILKPLENLADLSHRSLSLPISSTDIDLVIQSAIDAFEYHADHFPDGVMHELSQSGLPNDGTGVRSVKQGLLQALPEATADLELPPIHLTSFLSSPQFLQFRSLRSRYADWVKETADIFDERMFLEAWLLDGPYKDDEAEEFGVLPVDYSIAKGRLRLNKTVRFGSFYANTIEALLGWTDLSGVVSLMLTYCRGELRVRPTPVDLNLLENELDAITLLNDALFELIEEGYLVFLPEPR